MKIIAYLTPRLIIVLIASSLVITSMAQKGTGATPVSVITAEDISKLGTTQLSLQNIAGLSFGSNRFDGDKVSGTNRQQFSIRGLGAPVSDGLIVRGSLGIEHAGVKYEDVDQTENNLRGLAEIEVLKSINIGDHIIYGKASVGYLMINEKEEFEGNSNEFNRNGISWSAGAEYPILLGNTEVGLVPDLTYNYQKLNYDDGDEVYAGVHAGAGLRAFFRDDLDLFHTGNGPTYSNGKFDQGKLVFNGNTGVNLFFGKETQTTEFNGQTQEAEGNVTSYSLKGSGGYYVIDDLAVLAGVRYSREGLSDPDGDFSQSESRFLFNLGGRAHLSLLGAENLKNVYAETMIGLGSEGQSAEFDGNNNSDSEGSFAFRFNVGVDHFISPSVALFGKVGYNSYSVDDFGRGGFNIRSGFHFYPSCFHGQDAEGLPE